MSSEEGCLHDCEGFFVNQRVELGGIYVLELTNISFPLCLTQTKDKLIFTSPGGKIRNHIKIPSLPGRLTVLWFFLSFDEN